MNIKAILGAAAIIGVAIIVAVAMSLYFSPYWSCVRSRSVEDPAAAAEVCAAFVGGYRAPTY